MAQPELSSAELQARLGIKSSVFDRAVQQSSGVNSEVFEKFNGKEGDEYMLIFGASLSKLTNTNQELSGEHLADMEKQTAILSIAKALEGMKDLGNMLKFLDEMQNTFKNTPSVTTWIKEQISTVKNGVFKSAGQQFYWSVMHRWLSDWKAIGKYQNTDPSKTKIPMAPPSFCGISLLENIEGHPSQSSQLIAQFIQKRSNVTPTQIKRLNDYKSICNCFKYDFSDTCGWGNNYIKPCNTYLMARFAPMMRSMYGEDISDTMIQHAYFNQTFLESNVAWFGLDTHTHSSNIINMDKDDVNALNISAKAVGNNNSEFQKSASMNMNNIMSELESVSSEDQQISTTIQNLVVSPWNMKN